MLSSSGALVPWLVLVLAAPPDSDVDITETEASATPVASDAGAPDSAPDEPEPPPPGAAPTDEEPETFVPTGGSVAGSTIDPDDPNQGRAQSDLEGEALQRDSDLPERLPPLQRAGWWTTFGAVALGTTAGIFAGLAERQEDELDRLVYGVDLSTGSRFRYAEFDDVHTSMVQRGRTQMWVSRVSLIAAGASLVTSIALFAHDRRSRRSVQAPQARRPRVRFDPSSAEVRF